MIANLDAQKTFDAIRALKDGPEKKYKLIKVFGPALRRDGVPNIHAMSCAELVVEIDKRI